MIPSGHQGQKSPRRKRTRDLLDDSDSVKLRSPMKRSMSELNKLALNRALQIRYGSLVPGTSNDLIPNSEIDIVEDENRALADKIIALSKQDEYEPMHLEGESDSKKISPIHLQSYSLPKSPTRKRNIRRQPRRFYKSEQFKPKTDIKLMKIPDLGSGKDTLLIETDKEPKSLYYDGFEGYFEQQKLRVRKLSTSSMISAPQISYDDFHRYNSLLNIICKDRMHRLAEYYRLQYTQWLFELKQGYNIIAYGVGSKRTLLLDFVQSFLIDKLPDNTSYIVANGYNDELHPRTLLKSIWQIVFNRRPPTWHMIDSVRDLREAFKKRGGGKKQLVILLNNIDGDSLRKDRYHYVLSELSNIPQVYFICSIDNLKTPLFWNSSMLSKFNFIWHNVTTFNAYTTEISFHDPLSIGRSSEFVGSKGAKYVLGSLTSNAKSLYKNLLIQQLEKIDESVTSNEDMESRGQLKGNVKLSIPFRNFYEFCVSEFITSNVISFRTVLREFVEHNMCNLTKNTAGSEVLYIPFTVDEMEKILEDELLDN